MSFSTPRQNATIRNKPLPLSFRLPRIGYRMTMGLVLLVGLWIAYSPFVPFDEDGRILTFWLSGMIGGAVVCIAFVFLFGWLMIRSIRSRLRALGLGRFSWFGVQSLFDYLGIDLFRDPPPRFRECLSDPNEDDEDEIVAAWWEAESLEGRGPSPRTLAGLFREFHSRGELPLTRKGGFAKMDSNWHYLPFFGWMIFAVIWLGVHRGKAPLNLLFLPAPILSIVACLVVASAHAWIIARRRGYAFSWIEMVRTAHSMGWLWMPRREAWTRTGISLPRTREQYLRFLFRWVFVVQWMQWKV